MPKSLLGYAGSIGSPSTAYLYDWNILPLGQLLWEKELLSYKKFPPMQAPETYNLDGILDAKSRRPVPVTRATAERVTETRCPVMPAPVALAPQSWRTSAPFRQDRECKTSL